MHEKETNLNKWEIKHLHFLLIHNGVATVIEFLLNCFGIPSINIKMIWYKEIRNDQIYENKRNTYITLLK